SLSRLVLSTQSLSLACPRTRAPTFPTLFPYTTLFRSALAPRLSGQSANAYQPRGDLSQHLPQFREKDPASSHSSSPAQTSSHPRSEEHTSELQSRFDLVCRLLLEKKKK